MCHTCEELAQLLSSEHRHLPVVALCCTSQKVILIPSFCRIVMIAVTFNSTHCRTDADCRNGTRFTGSVCSFDSGLSAVVRQIESCSNGVDTITRTGSCIDFCSTQQAYVDSMNTRVNQYACSGPYADCGTGMSCKASSLCNKLACANATVGIVTVPCYGFCVASEREILSAKMSNDGKSITAALNTAAAPGTFPCAAVFVGSTMEKLGYDAQCFVSSESAQSKVLVITLGPQSTFMPEVDTLSVSDTQRLLVDILNTKERFTGASIPVAKCAGTDCTGATAALFGPKVSLPNVMLCLCTCTQHVGMCCTEGWAGAISRTAAKVPADIISPSAKLVTCCSPYLSHVMRRQQGM